MALSFTPDEVERLHDMACGVLAIMPERDGRGLRLPDSILAEEVEAFLRDTYLAGNGITVTVMAAHRAETALA